MSDSERVSVNAWTGNSTDCEGEFAEDAYSWGIATHASAPRFLAADDDADERNWADASIGWGLVLPDDEAIPNDKKRFPDENGSQAIKELWEARPGSVMLRYRDDIPGMIRRFYPDGTHEDLLMAGSRQGTDRGCLPKYMLIVASPDEIPWEFQFQLNLIAFVGRLDLDDLGLANYVSALVGDWNGATCTSNQPVLWSSSYDEITKLMLETIAEPTAALLAGDSQIGDEHRFLEETDATRKNLLDSLRDRNPALIVTTSHGATSPVSNPIEMKTQLGCLVDQNKQVISPQEILAQWSPYGAIWYAHACCSAGSTGESTYAPLFPEGAPLRNLLEGIAVAGTCTSPTPTALLGCEKPLRAFIGHVEPTFDWTLRQPLTKQVLTDGIVTAFYKRMHKADPETLGMAFQKIYDSIGALLNMHSTAVRDVGRNREVTKNKTLALRSQLAAFDRRSMVLLGCPTVTLPRLT